MGTTKPAQRAEAPPTALRRATQVPQPQTGPPRLAPETGVARRKPPRPGRRPRGPPVRPEGSARVAGLLYVAPELLAHGGKDPVGEVGFAARAETFVKGRGEHVRRHRLVHRRLHRPAPFARVRHPALER